MKPLQRKRLGSLELFGDTHSMLLFTGNHVIEMPRNKVQELVAHLTEWLSETPETTSDTSHSARTVETAVA
jgi:hypothetical protein